MLLPLADVQTTGAEPFKRKEEVWHWRIDLLWVNLKHYCHAPSHLIEALKYTKVLLLLELLAVPRHLRLLELHAAPCPLPPDQQVMETTCSNGYSSPSTFQWGIRPSIANFAFVHTMDESLT